MNILLKTTGILLQSKFLSRALCTTPATYTEEWRTSRGLPRNRNAAGILTDGPDFTYINGKPTPLLHGQKKRILWQRDLATKIVELCSEVDFAKERHRNMEKAKEEERVNVISNRLKPKGVALYKKK